MRILIADPLSEAGVAKLAAEFDVVVAPGLSKAELVGLVGGFEGLVVRSSTVVDAEVIAAGERLRVIARAGIGLDNVDVAAATARGVLVCNAPQSNVISAAEHTLALLLALVRRVPQADRAGRAGWGRWGGVGGGRRPGGGHGAQRSPAGSSRPSPSACIVAGGLP